jgi:hypothetical protein
MPLQVIGAGLGRTGTMSLKLALEQLGFGPCFHMVEIFRQPRLAALWERAAKGEPADWEDVFRGFRATVDWPSCNFYNELANLYPEARIILTERDPQEWFESTQKTIFADLDDLLADQSNPWTRMTKIVIHDFFDGRLHDREHAIAVYEHHNEMVRQIIPSDRLLTYEVAQGWEPLCRFLGVPVPATPFPKANTTDDFLARQGGNLPIIGNPFRRKPR